MVRYRCPGCGRDMLVAFSCKRRGLCPSCDAKRSAIITGAAMDRLLPLAPYRQWVLVVPKRLRYFINRNPALAGKVSKILAREINRYLANKAMGAPAQLHFIQRFGGALNLHVHVHAVVSDGVFNIKPGFMGRPELEFNPVPVPTEEEFSRIAAAICRKVIRQVRRYGGLHSIHNAMMMSFTLFWGKSGCALLNLKSLKNCALLISTHPHPPTIDKSRVLCHSIDRLRPKLSAGLCQGGVVCLV